MALTNPNLSTEQIRDVNVRYHDAAAERYDSKWAIDYGEIGARPGADEAAQGARPRARPLPAGARDRRRHGLLHAQSAARGRDRARRPRPTSPPGCCGGSTRRRTSWASRSRRCAPMPSTCRSTTDRSTSCSATPSCTTSPTSGARWPSSVACWLRAARLPSWASRPATATGSPPRPSGSGRSRRPPGGGSSGPAPKAAAAPGDANRPERDGAVVGARVQVDVHTFAPDELRGLAERRGFEDVRVSGEELVANAYGWMLRSLEAARRAGDASRCAGTVRLPQLPALQRGRPAAARARLPPAPVLQPAAVGPQAVIKRLSRLGRGFVHLAHAKRAARTTSRSSRCRWCCCRARWSRCTSSRSATRTMIARLPRRGTRVRHRLALRRRAEGGRLHGPDGRGARADGGRPDEHPRARAHPFRLLARQEDHAYPAGTIELLDDRTADESEDPAAGEARERYADLLEHITDERPEEAALAELSAYEMAASVEIDLPVKQGLLELRSEQERLRLLARLFKDGDASAWRSPSGSPSARQRTGR